MIKNIFMIFGLILAIVGFIVILSYSIDFPEWRLIVVLCIIVFYICRKEGDDNDEII